MQSSSLLVATAMASAVAVSGCTSLPPPNSPNPAIAEKDAAISAERQFKVMQTFVYYSEVPEADSEYWYEVMEVGFNYVDEKCDQYLHDLSSFQRHNDRLKKGFILTDKTTSAILAASGASTASLSVVAALFGFGAQATDIVAGSYLFNVSPGIVYKNVRDAQAAYRIQTALDDQEKFITTRSAAFNRIRGYLALCLPVSIEARIEENLMKTTAVAKQPDAKEQAGAKGAATKDTGTTKDEKRAAGAAAPMIETVPAE